MHREPEWNRAEGHIDAKSSASVSPRSGSGCPNPAEAADFGKLSPAGSGTWDRRTDRRTDRPEGHIDAKSSANASLPRLNVKWLDGSIAKRILDGEKNFNGKKSFDSKKSFGGKRNFDGE